MLATCHLARRAVPGPELYYRYILPNRRQYDHIGKLVNPACPASQYARSCSRVGRLSTIYSYSHCHSHSNSRSYSTLVPPTIASEDVEVECRSNGSITLNIFHPTLHVDVQPPVVIYLPSGPEAKGELGINDTHVVSALSAVTNSTVVRLNYRLGNGIQYPMPIHDVLAGYDYVKQRFSSTDTWTTRQGRLRKPSLRIGVCGQLVGGSLAAMLALTESRLAEDRVAAVALNCPVVDWVFLETAAGASQDPSISAGGDQGDQGLEKALKRRKKRLLTSWERDVQINNIPIKASLEKSRDTLFGKPANYFDPFASPMLLLRSSGVEVPSDRPLEGSEAGLLHPFRPKFRKARRAFPPTGSTLILPDVRLSIGEQNPLFDQGEEFVKLLRRSIVDNFQKKSESQAMLDRFAELSLTEDQRLEAAVSAAEERVEFHISAKLGLWGGSDTLQWTDEVQSVGAWFRTVLS